VHAGRIREIWPVWRCLILLPAKIWLACGNDGLSAAAQEKQSRHAGGMRGLRQGNLACCCSG